jgi:hypothetical protein
MVREEPEKLTTLVDRIATRHLAADGVIVFRHDARDAVAFPAAAVADQRTYGEMTIELLRRR